ncbi:hypothetical protein KSC_102680 [Ktedonobacter sp. SOSP1-52]|nr:hypothetical protein KSC_102680 [Ktedonobacter sp. SOSP1-52]
MRELSLHAVGSEQMSRYSSFSVDVLTAVVSNVGEAMHNSCTPPGKLRGKMGCAFALAQVCLV